jgi:hypothetical protein
VRPPGGRPPASFGRPAPTEEDEQVAVKGGQPFHIVISADVTPSKESLATLFTAVRETTRQAVIAGYADAFAEMDQPAEELPGGGHGGASPGPAVDGA